MVANEWLRILVGPVISGAIVPPNFKSTKSNKNLNPSVFAEISTACHRLKRWSLISSVLSVVYYQQGSITQAL